MTINCTVSFTSERQFADGGEVKNSSPPVQQVGCSGYLSNDIEELAAGRELKITFRKHFGRPEE